MITHAYAKSQADHFETLANEQTKNHGEAWFLTMEHREDAAYWRGIQWALQEFEAGRLTTSTAQKGT